MENTQQPSLLDVFENLEEPTKQLLADVKSPLTLGLATLALAESKAKRPYMSAEHIVAALEAAGVAIKQTQIGKAFARAGNKISRKVIDGETCYRIMTSGQREVKGLFESQGEISVSYVEGGKPRTARKLLADMLSSLSGEIKVCDPYYGLRTLDALEMIPVNCSVKFLTAQTTEKPIKLSGAISDFKKEHPKTELRVFPDPKSLHDRYILSSDFLLILGHGIKDIGNKESFVVSISNDYAGDLLDSLEKTFEDRWAVSTIL
ncbi:MAG: hypothetical protein HND47_09805 [Chloroflexi bacterium]|nr:hypothetical protein [Chloroflexota bacterium]